MTREEKVQKIQEQSFSFFNRITSVFKKYKYQNAEFEYYKPSKINIPDDYGMPMFVVIFKEPVPIDEKLLDRIVVKQQKILNDIIKMIQKENNKLENTNLSYGYDVINNMLNIQMYHNGFNALGGHDDLFESFNAFAQGQTSLMESFNGFADL